MGFIYVPLRASHAAQNHVPAEVPLIIDHSKNLQDERSHRPPWRAQLPTPPWFASQDARCRLAEVMCGGLASIAVLGGFTDAAAGAEAGDQGPRHGDMVLQAPHF